MHPHHQYTPPYCCFVTAWRHLCTHTHVSTSHSERFFFCFHLSNYDGCAQECQSRGIVSIYTKYKKSKIKKRRTATVVATSWLRDPDDYLGKEFSLRRERKREIRVTQSFVTFTPTICRLIRISSRFHLDIFFF